jgi:steroid delta-isomerase-like uncharacterized protein
MSAEENRLAMQRIERAFNTGEVSIVDEVVHEDHVDQTPHPGDQANREGLKQQIRAMRNAFPDARFEITKMVAEGDWVAYEWRMQGTQRGELFGHPPSGKALRHHGAGFVTFRDGKMVQHRSGDNLRGMLNELGHSPEYRDLVGRLTPQW